MLKSSIILNSFVTFFILIINFTFKIYLAKEFPKIDLVIYYSIMDALSVITRIFVGYKDALTTIYNQTDFKLEIMKTFTVFFLWVITLVSILIIPFIVNDYLINKIENFQLPWWYISILFVLMNLVSYFGYIFIVTKYYKLISFNDFIKKISLIAFILFLYLIINLKASYNTLIIANIFSCLTVLLYLIFKQKKHLPDYSILKLAGFKFPKFNDNTNKQFITLTMMASSNYFVYGLLLFAPIYTLLNYGDVNTLANYQVVARSIYVALVSVFSWPLARFMFPEFSFLIKNKKLDTLYVIRGKFIKLIILFSIIIIPSCLMLSKTIISLMFPIDYIDSYKLINILIFALPFVMYQNFSESIIKARGSYLINLLIKSSGIIIYIISYLMLNFIFNLKLSPIYAFTFGLLSIFIISLYFERKIISKL